MPSGAECPEAPFVLFVMPRGAGGDAARVAFASLASEAPQDVGCCRARR